MSEAQKLIDSLNDMICRANNRTLKSVDTATKPGKVILTFHDGTVEEFADNDPEFLNQRFRLSNQ